MTKQIKTYRIYELDHTSSETYVKKQDHDEIVNAIKQELKEEIKSSNYIIKKLVEVLNSIYSSEITYFEQNGKPDQYEYIANVLKEIGEL